MSLLAIDPGPERSAWLELENGRPANFAIMENADVLHIISTTDANMLAIEGIASYGMAVGAEVFETCVWTGRFLQRWYDAARSPLLRARAHRVYRRDVKLHLCGSARAKDPNVRQALIDMYGPGKEKAIGKKASPGPLYGVTSHVWSALAVAVTAEHLSEQAAKEAA